MTGACFHASKYSIHILRQNQLKAIHMNMTSGRPQEYSLAIINEESKLDQMQSISICRVLSKLATDCY